MGAEQMVYRVTGEDLQQLAKAVSNINFHEIMGHVSERNLHEFIFTWRMEISDIMMRFIPCGYDK